MNKIQGINGYIGPPSVQSQNSSDSAGARPLFEPESKDDRVEISQLSRFMSEISAMPEIRSKKVEQIRQSITQGTYDVNSKLSEALNRFLEENY